MINEIKTFEERKQELLEIGLKNKKVTFEEIAEKLKGIEPDSDLLDDLYNMPIFYQSYSGQYRLKSCLTVFCEKFIGYFFITFW